MENVKGAVLVNPLALEMAAKFASDEVARPTLCKVRVKADGGLEATDGHRAIRVRPLGQPVEEYPACLPYGQHAPEAAGVLVPKAVADKFAKSARRLTGKMAQPILLTVAVSTNATHASLTATNLDSTAREDFRVDGEERFPDMEQVWPKKEPVLRIGFNALMLAEVLTALAKLSDGRPENGITLEFFGPLAACVVTNSDASAQALVMPTRMPDAIG